MNHLKLIFNAVIIIFLMQILVPSWAQQGPPQGPPTSYDPNGGGTEDYSVGGGQGGGSIIQIRGEIVEGIKGNFSGQFDSTPVADVLNIISRQIGLNIMVSPKVNATVTGNFKDVAIKDAFLAMLSANNLYYLEQGKIIKIMTMAEYKNELLQNYLETRSYDTSVIDLKNLASIIKPFLTPGIGKVNVDQQSSKILVTDVKDNFPRIDELYKEISSLPKMIEIETKIIEVNVNDESALGVNWSVSNLANAFSINVSPTPSSGVANSTGNANQTVNITGAHVFAPSSTSLQVMLSMMESELDARVISQPIILAMNRQEAKILIGGKVPYVSSTSTATTGTGEKTAQVEFAEVGLKIIITPMVTPDGKIKMKIYVSQSSSQLIDITSDQKAPNISTSEVECEAVSMNGQPIVIGGLMKTTKNKSQQSIPILGKIPILKYLFSYSTDVMKKDELIIILTPRIVNPGDSNLNAKDHSKEVQEELKDKK